MSIRALQKLTSSVGKVADELGRMNEQLDKAANTRFTSLPASFTPPSPLSPPGTPGNPLPSDPLAPIPSPNRPTTILDSNGNPIQRSPGLNQGISSGGSGGDNRNSFKLPDDPFVKPIAGDLAHMMRKSLLEAYLSMGTCQIYESPDGLRTISCPWGAYPDITSNGVLSSMSANPTEGAKGGPRTRPSGGFTGHQQGTTGTRESDLSKHDHGSSRSSISSSTAVSPLLDSRPITDRLDGVRSDLRDLTRAIQGDGGASIRLRNGI